MSPGDTIFRSPLDKPLNELTEDEMSQVTREDCRRFLKEKGMRRPSWNKSQAIQQVISLKTLLETTSDSDGFEAQKKLYIPGPQNQPRVVSDSNVLPNKTTQRIGISVPIDVSVPRSCPDPSKSGFTSAASDGTAISANGSVSPRTAGASKEPAGQMTIFYSGKVNVYDDMPGCKAESIFQLAASPVSFPQETLPDQRTTPWSIPCHLQAEVKVAENCQFPQEVSNISHEDSLEGPATRKASVQRYLEKRKDRFKNKRKLATSSPPTVDIYLNEVGDQFSNGQLKESEAFSSTLAWPSHMPLICSSIETVPRIVSLTTHPNAKDIFEV